MRRVALASCLALLSVAAVPASARQLPPLPVDATYRATDNVELVARFPEHAGTAGGRLSGDGTRFYLTDPRGVYVYDVTTPEAPRLLGQLPLPQGGETGAALGQEDPDTDGTVLLVDELAPSGSLGQLAVVDVRDPSALRVAARLPVKDHIWTCVSGVDVTGATRGCAFAYGRSGYIVDLRDPARPVLAQQSWRAAVGYGNIGNPSAQYTHDLTEIRPGLVMSAGRAAILMDTTDPLAPRRLTALEQPGRFSSLGYHSVEWAGGGRDPYLVLGTEIAPSAAPGAPDLAGSDCEGPNSVIETWDARAVVAALEAYEANGRDASVFAGVGFTRIDTYDAGTRGLFLEGRAAAHELYCAHWMELEPDFAAGGRMAVAYYNRGTRFVEVGSDGAMTELGWITAAEGYAASPQWITDDVVYSLDYRRGLEVLRLRPAPAAGVVSGR